MPTWPIAGFDRGLGQFGAGTGTPSPPSNVQLRTSGASLGFNPDGTAYLFEEEIDSPQIDRGEQFTVKHRFKCDYYTGTQIIASLGRGDYQTDSGGNVFRVLSVGLDVDSATKGNTAILSTVSECVSAVVPPDEFSVDAVEFNPALFRHPIFSKTLNYNLPPTPTSPNPSPAELNGFQIISAIYNSVNSGSLPSQSEFTSLLNPQNITDGSVRANASLLLQKLQKNEETFYLAGVKLNFTQFSFVPWDINPGGYIEDPFATSAIPPFFWSRNGDGSDNVFNTLASQVNPQMYGNDTPGAFIFLRLCDNQVFDRTFFKLTSSWIGGPSGSPTLGANYWDTDIYPVGAFNFGGD